MSESLDLAGDLLKRARAAGADAADAVVIEGASLALTRRLGATEKLERSEQMDLGLRVFVGQRQAIVSSSDFSKEALDGLAERAVAMAREVPEDPYCGLASPDQLAVEFPDLDACDAFVPDPDILADWARRAEDTARATPGVSNSEGAEAGWSRHRVAIAASNGFAHSRMVSGFSLFVSVLAGEGTAMERDYDYASATHAEDLRSPEELGRTAGEKAVKRLNPRRVSTGKFPIIYDPRVSKSLLGHLSSAINGAVIARGTSFLKDRMGESIFPDNITIVDDPLRRRGLRSRSFDAEGLRTKRLDLVKEGALTSWILDLQSARKLDLAPTGHAGRSTSGPPSPGASNLYMENGDLSPVELMADIKEGLYVTELIGMGVNMVTGDYSRGGAGFWIENGQISYPVSELTLAGSLPDMFRQTTPANDLEFRYGSDAPSLRVDGMTIAGQ